MVLYEGSKAELNDWRKVPLAAMVSRTSFDPLKVISQPKHKPVINLSTIIAPLKLAIAPEMTYALSP